MGIRENAFSAMFAFRITLNNTNRKKSSKKVLGKEISHRKPSINVGF